MAPPRPTAALTVPARQRLSVASASTRARLGEPRSHAMRTQIVGSSARKALSASCAGGREAGLRSSGVKPGCEGHFRVRMRVHEGATQVWIARTRTTVRGGVKGQGCQGEGAGEGKGEDADEGATQGPAGGRRR